MKILYVTGAGKYGAYILSRELFKIWLKHGHEIVFVSYGPDALVEFAQEHKIRVYTLPLVRTFQIFRALRLAKIVKLEKPDVIHACNMLAGRFLCAVASVLSRTPLVLYLGIPQKIYNNNPVIKMVQRFLHRWTVLQARSIISVTHFLAEELRTELSLTPNIDIAVIPIGVDPEQIPEKKYDLTDAFVPHNPVKLVQVARLAPEKGQSTVLHAVRDVIEKGHQVTLDFIGDASYPNYTVFLHNLRNKLGLSAQTVRFLGFHPVSQIYELLQNYDLFLHPSRDEAQGISVLEAMAAGLPVIVANDGGQKEIVINEKTGLWVPPNDPLALSGAIIDLITKPQKMFEMGRAGRRHVTTHLSIEQTELKLIRFYEQLFERFSREGLLLCR